MDDTTTTQKTLATRVLQWCGGNRHFLIAVALLAGMGLATVAVGWIVKYPVPWPKSVTVDAGFRLLSLPGGLPVDMPRYVKVDRDGSYYREKDGQIDGERIFDKKLKRALGIGTSYDRDRYPHRRSNWYVSRIYEDTHVKAQGDPYRFWRLEVYYYPGVRDKVPHVPGICAQAGGARILSERAVEMSVPGLREPWDEFDVWRVEYEFNRQGGRLKRADYYVFNCNGGPQTDRLIVRGLLAYSLQKHNFFAKIQFSPAGYAGIGSIPEADEAARTFLRAVLPDVLKMLPTSEDIRGLDTEAGQKK